MCLSGTCYLTLPQGAVKEHIEIYATTLDFQALIIILIIGEKSKKSCWRLQNERAVAVFQCRLNEGIKLFNELVNFFECLTGIP